MKQLIILATLAGLAVNAHASTNVMCHSHSMEAQHSDQARVFSTDHQVTITNNTTVQEVYYIVYKSIVDGQLVKSETIDVKIHPGATYRDSKQLDRSLVFKKKNTYNAQCETWVGGPESADIKGGGYIKIT